MASQSVGKERSTMKTIRFAQLSDAPALLSIYAHYVENSVITFEYDVPSLEEFEGRMMKIQREYPYLVCELDQNIVGYAYAHRHMERAAYQWNVEVSIYLLPQVQRRQIGTALYTALLEILKLQGLQTAISCITLPNDASLALHRSFGFTEIGVLRNAGYKFDAWRDVIWLQKALHEHPVPVQEWISIEQLDYIRIMEIFHTTCMIII